LHGGDEADDLPGGASLTSSWVRPVGVLPLTTSKARSAPMGSRRSRLRMRDGSSPAPCSALAAQIQALRIDG
jgi:hypothetical protein